VEWWIELLYTNSASGNSGWYTLFADQVFEKHSCEVWGVNVLSAGEVSLHLSQTVDNYQDPGVSRCCWLWQVGNKIHCKSLPGMTWWWQWHVESIEWMTQCCDSVAQLAAGNVHPYLLLRCSPIKISWYQLGSRLGCEETGLGVVVDMSGHSTAVCHGRVYHSLIGQSSVDWSLDTLISDLNIDQGWPYFWG